MKKSILLIAAMFSFAVIFTSCNEVKKGEAKTEKHDDHDGHNYAAKEVVSAKVTFQCPMDCEKGKTYGEAGNCPTCKMALKANKTECKTACAGKKECKPADCKDKKDCKPADCKDKKDCKPEACGDKTACASKKECKTDSSCKDKKELARIKQDCTHCEPGNCECKA